VLSFYVPYNILLNCCHRFSVFDASIDRYNVYKVETIGDAYMVASGLPTVYDRHAQEMSLLALELLDSVKNLVIPHLPHQKLQLRIGLHSGESAHFRSFLFIMILVLSNGRVVATFSITTLHLCAVLLSTHAALNKLPEATSLALQFSY